MYSFIHRSSTANVGEEAMVEGSTIFKDVWGKVVEVSTSIVKINFDGKIGIYSNFKSNLSKEEKHTVFVRKMNIDFDIPEGVDFICHRVYANGDVKYTVRDLDGLKSWLEYNLICRGGNRLYVNGEAVNYFDGSKTGYLRGPNALAADMAIKQDYESRKSKEKAWRTSLQSDGYGTEVRMRYPDDREIGMISFTRAKILNRRDMFKSL